MKIVVTSEFLAVPLDTNHAIRLAEIPQVTEISVVRCG